VVTSPLSSEALQKVDDGHDMLVRNVPALPSEIGADHFDPLKVTTCADSSPPATAQNVGVGQETGPPIIPMSTGADQPVPFHVRAWLSMTATQNVEDVHETDGGAVLVGTGRRACWVHVVPLNVAVKPVKSMAMQKVGEAHDTDEVRPCGSASFGFDHVWPSKREKYPEEVRVTQNLAEAQDTVVSSPLGSTTCGVPHAVPSKMDARTRPIATQNVGSAQLRAELTLMCGPAGDVVHRLPSNAAHPLMPSARHEVAEAQERALTRPGDPNTCTGFAHVPLR